jgi:hypothetical protein
MSDLAVIQGQQPVAVRESIKSYILEDANQR